ncbi:hypothetical protein Goshw_002149, partial [Gossypium schwendimanii]|nr:hypothetical protein [Gossypium schwendimanii]
CAIWAIWTSRNRWIHKGRKKSGAETVKFIKQYIHELIELDRKNLALSPYSDRWRPPQLAEAIACVQAVTVGRDLGITHVEIERDCLTIIK